MYLGGDEWVNVWDWYVDLWDSINVKLCLVKDVGGRVFYYVSYLWDGELCIEMCCGKLYYIYLNFWVVVYIFDVIKGNIDWIGGEV